MRFRIPFIYALALCLAVPAAGQGPVRDFQYRQDLNPLLGFGNAAVLVTLGDEGFSAASASFSKENGSLIPLEGSPDCWTAGAQTQSYRRVSDKLVFSGALQYSQFRGNGMGSQILMNPGNNAVNFLEEDLSTVGKKRRETYSLSGGLSWSFNDRLSAGIQIDYTAADQAKFKDPRFLNTRMDLNLAPGVMFKISDSFLLGGNLIYDHSIEQLSAGNFGTVEKTYYILVDQGAFMGGKEEFTGDIGYVSDDNIRPLVDDHYGLSLQVAAGKRTRFYGKLSGSWRTGYFGSRTSTSVVFCEFKGPEASFEGVLDLHSGVNLHRIALTGGMKMLTNYTNSYTHKHTAGMNTVVEYHGQNRTVDKNSFAGSLAYSFHKDVRGFRPAWLIQARADAGLKSISTVIYPDYRDQSFLQTAFTLDAERNIIRKNNCFTVKIAAGFAAGFGNAKTDGSYTGGSSKVKSFDDWLNRQFEFDTAPRAGASLDLAWTLLRYNKLAPYIKLSESFDSLLSESQYLDGRTRNLAAVTLGCNF